MKGIVNFGINNVVKGNTLNGNFVISQKKTTTKNKQEIIKQNLIYNCLNELNYLKQK